MPRARTEKDDTARSRAIARTLARDIRTRRLVTPAVTVVGEKTHDPFLILVSTVLSIRTRDTVTGAASSRLFAVAATPEALMHLSGARIQKLIYPVNMYPTKARWLREIARAIVSTHGGKVPRTRDELIALPGVGRKVANLVLGLGFGVPAICVDTHVHRISNRLGLVVTKTPEQTEYALERVLPKNLWVPWNDLLVTWGQNVCVPQRPFCSTCILKQKGLCPQVGVVKPR